MSTLGSGPLERHTHEAAVLVRREEFRVLVDHVSGLASLLDLVHREAFLLVGGQQSMDRGSVFRVDCIELDQVILDDDRVAELEGAAHQRGESDS